MGGGVDRRWAFVLATDFFGGFAGMLRLGMASFYLCGAYPPRVARASTMTIFPLLAPACVALFGAIGAGGWRELGMALALFPAVRLGDLAWQAAFGRVGRRAWQGAVALTLARAAPGALCKLPGVRRAAPARPGSAPARSRAPAGGGRIRSRYRQGRRL